MIKTCFLLLLLFVQVSLGTYHHDGANRRCNADSDCRRNQCCELPRRGKRSTFGSGTCIALSGLGEQCYIPFPGGVACPRCSGLFVCKGSGTIVVPQGEIGKCIYPRRGK